MILTVGVAVRLEAREGQFSEVWDARILTAAREILLARPDVKEVEFVPQPEGSVAPVFAVALDPPLGFVTMSMASLLAIDGKFDLVYAEDGGWKIQLLDLLFEVTPL